MNMTAEQRAALEWLICEDASGEPLGSASQAAIAAALADLDTATAALFVVEWQASGYDGAQTVAACPWCRMANPDHATGCGLAAVLAAAAREKTP